MSESRHIPSWTAEVFKILKRMQKHRERYIRAWMLAYGADPRDVVLVTTEMHMGGGSSFRVEFAKTADPVVELVKAARACDEQHRASDGLIDAHGRPLGSMSAAQLRLRFALKHFSGV